MIHTQREISHSLGLTGYKPGAESSGRVAYVMWVEGTGYLDHHLLPPRAHPSRKTLRNTSIKIRHSEIWSQGTGVIH